jgi:MT-A70
MKINLESESGWILLADEDYGGYKLKTCDAVTEPYVRKPVDSGEQTGKVKRIRKKKAPVLNALQSAHIEFMNMLGMKFNHVIITALGEGLPHFPVKVEAGTGVSQPDVDSQLKLAENCQMAYLANASCLISTITLSPFETEIPPIDIFNVHYCTSSQWIYPTIGCRKFLIPPNSEFIVSQFDSFKTYLKTLPKYDLIVADPPWPNKSVSRSGSYDEMDVYDLFHFELGKKLTNNGMVAMWVTNKEKYHTFITEKLFPAWGLQAVGEWVWIKVTTEGEVVFDIERYSDLTQRSSQTI